MAMNPNLQGMSFDSNSKYKIDKELGRGGMGIVYKAERDTGGIKDLVALKILFGLEDEQIISLRQEAETSATLKHHNIVKTYGLEELVGESLSADTRKDLALTKTLFLNETIKLPETKKVSEKYPCMVMDYVEGIDLGKLFKQHLEKDLLIPVYFTAFIIEQICHALDYTQRKALVHRDISPENIIIDENGVPKLMDFGVAIARGEEQKLVIGKVKYMSPEQLEGQALDTRSDIFSLGLVAYQMLTGIDLLFPPTSMDQTHLAFYAFNRISEGFPMPHEVCNDIPKEVSSIVSNMIQPGKNHRYTLPSEIFRKLKEKYLGSSMTYEALEAYMDCFEKNFIYTSEDYSSFTNDIENAVMPFLANTSHYLPVERRIRRELKWDNYTPLGQHLIKQTQKQTPLWKRIREQLR